MDTKNYYNIESCYRLLALCVQVKPHALLDERLKQALQTFSAWDDLSTQSELHGMSPLLWHHIQRLELSIPSHSKKILNTLYLRQRAFHQAHTSTLLEVTHLLEKNKIRAVVLKGLALAYQYYPNPILRPASDIDLLLKKDDLLPALDLLREAGYQTATTPHADFNLLPKELIISSPPKLGISTRIELHHYNPHAKSAFDNSPDDEFTGFDKPPQKIKVDQQIIHVPHFENHLDYLVRHLARHLFVATNEKPLSLKWIADIVNLVEHHAQEINWKENKILLNRLEVIYSLTPFPKALLKVIPIQHTQVSQGVNQYPQGWPQQVFPAWKQKGILYYLTKTILSPTYIWHTLSAPSAWWLRLQYGIEAKSIFWYGQVVYRLQVLRMFFSKVARNKN